MIDKYFSYPRTLRRLRAGLCGIQIDGFAGALEKQGYARATAIRYLRAAAHLGSFLQRKGRALDDMDGRLLEAFGRHFSHCRCSRYNGRKTGYHARFGVKLFYRYLIQQGVCQGLPTGDVTSDQPALVIAFRDWLHIHRGAFATAQLFYYYPDSDFELAMWLDFALLTSTGRPAPYRLPGRADAKCVCLYPRMLAML